jgi:uncharacterized protein (TIGR02246 family)
MTPVETALLFLYRINQRDPDKLAELMTEDHVFIDSLGNQVRGREAMRKGWRSYYAMCPDYRASHKEIFASGNIVAVFGTAGGTISEHRWETPAAWRAVIENERIKEWRVYADNKPVYDVLAKSK